MAVRFVGPPQGVRGARLDIPRLRTRAGVLMRALRIGGAELSIALVDDLEIAALNRQWRGKAGPTDVLSFSLLEGEHRVHRGMLLGDVVISVETAAAQAAVRHRGLDEEVARLLIHGLLHLLGHEHEQDEQARTMEAEQRRLWQKIRPRSAAHIGPDGQ
jgi:probable rRNA maturation factor